MTRLGGQAPDATTPPPTPAASEARIKAALWFAAQGFGVFPCWSALDGVCRCPKGAACGSPAKHPLSEHGFKDATTDEKRIRTFLSAASLPNYGLVCPDGVFALDVDGEGWEARLAELETRLGPLPPTLRTATRNGQHIYLRWPADLPRPMKQMFGWVTRWGSGGTSGYVIGPRSVHASGFEYAPVGAFEVGVLPDAWAKAAVTPSDPAGTLTIRAGADPTNVPVGGRHDFLRDQARFTAGTVRDPDALFAAIWAINTKLPVPKDEESVRRAIGDALTKYPADPVDEQTEERIQPGEPGLLAPSVDDSLFPDPPSRVAFGGLLGECVDALAPGTDASEVGLLASLLAFSGALFPARSYLHAYHTTSPMLALVGKSSIGRKGTAMFRARDALGNALGMEVVNRVKLNGLASGEALVRALLDRDRENFGHPTGVLFEEEYATFLAASGREGSTLDSRMRAAFDGGALANRRAAETVAVPEPYWLSGLVAITPSELQARVVKESFHNGSGNRWLWLPVVQRDVIADGLEPVLPRSISDPMKQAHDEANRRPPTLPPGTGVGELVSEYDRFLRSETVGLAADMTRRFGIIAFRIGLVHAAVEQASAVGREHIRRGIALTEYARAGLAWTFGEALGDGLATLLLRHLKEEGVLTNGTISKYLVRDPQKRQAAVDELQRLGLAEVTSVRTGGRRRTELRLVPEKGGFRDFRALIATEAEPRTPNSAENARKSVDGSAEGAQKVRESARNLGWTTPCRDYTNHQDHHRLEAHGWVCIRCDGGGTDR